MSYKNYHQISIRYQRYKRDSEGNLIKFPVICHYIGLQKASAKSFDLEHTFLFDETGITEKFGIYYRSLTEAMVELDKIKNNGRYWLYKLYYLESGCIDCRLEAYEDVKSLFVSSGLNSTTRIYGETVVAEKLIRDECDNKYQFFLQTFRSVIPKLNSSGNAPTKKIIDSYLQKENPAI